MSFTASGSTRHSRRKIKDMIAVNFGNALEWYDWNIYTIFAVVFASQIFKAGNPTSALLSTLAVFAVGFIARPIGGFIFGAVADKVGRKRSLFIAMVVTAVGSLIIAVTPTYAAAGILAPIVLTVARLLQGLAHGGEMGTSVTYLVERAPDNRRGFFGATSWISVVIGTILATLVGLGINTFLSPDQVATWGWRMAFALGGILGLYALVLRRTIEESEHYTATQEINEVTQSPAGQGDASESSASSIMRGLWIIFVVSASGSLMFYTWLIYLPTHAQQVHQLPPTQTLSASLIAQVIFMAAIFGAGMLGDRVGRKPMVIVFSLLFVILPYPLFGILGSSFVSFLAVQTVALLGVAVLFGVNGALWSEVLPTEVRAKGVATVLSLATAIFGGTAPYVITWLNANNLPNVFPGYLMVMAALTGITALFMKETKGISLSR
ncbi:transporter, major facilitator family protein [Brevibacterium mcbrellneri ATCC 49030]|uniref:Transporter, major facilitator family protein n=2 Tax=Brevibacterium TaxID=1696 RepID=D4YMW5_9MICO|nr:transporter, major facilitator family protein [Brevibacterium mcbrellneri ATCC 49030]